MPGKMTVRWQGSTRCDFCGKNARDVDKSFVDGKTSRGPWALMCMLCWKLHGIGKLGKGWGQRYDSETLKKVEG